MHIRLTALSLVTALCVAGATSQRLAAAELVMFEQRGCEWCEMWDAQIAPIYPKTEEGAFAPLRRIDIHEPMPDDLAWMRGERFTPSFALVHEGREYGRIRGYPGEDFFWGLLAEMVGKLKGTLGGDQASNGTRTPG
ncbi:transcriptional regulator [Stappia sp. MMSF_3263]|uniref:transcriptional regulator n=1 Tax=Stappia sp. MMSF_3263 TaxID=3046693 RepID=UPI00273F44E4|nr:transcriptional regulator [Stappia sp. MMSF_3263]